MYGMCFRRGSGYYIILWVSVSVIGWFIVCIEENMYRYHEQIPT